MTWFGFSVVAIAATEPMAYVQSIPEIIMYMQQSTRSAEFSGVISP